MTGRHGFSLVEMVIVLVLAGIVSTAAISMFSTQNRLNAHITALGESQENARSAVMVAADELRTAASGAVVTARADRIVLHVPIVIGVICGVRNPQFKAAYFPMNGRTIDLRTEVDGYAFRSQYGDWAHEYASRPSDGFNGASARQYCIDAGGGTVGDNGDYAILRVGGGVGSAVMLYRTISYHFGTSALDTSRRAFFRSDGDEAIELAHGFSEDTGFEFQLSQDTTWVSELDETQDIRRITAVRIVGAVVGEGTSGSATRKATFELGREIRLRNARS